MTKFNISLWLLPIVGYLPKLGLAQLACRICSYPNSALLKNKTTLASHPRLPLFFDANKQQTCNDWQSYATHQSLQDDTLECLSLRHRLMRYCCDGVPPEYSCQKRLRNRLLFNDELKYDSNVCPISGSDSSIDVTLFMNVSELSIINYGVHGGSIQVIGIMHLTWVDEQLGWNPSEIGCTEFRVRASRDPKISEIWFPMIRDDFATTVSSRATVFADGSVSWNGQFQLEADCETVGEDWSKLCTVSFGGSTAEALWDKNDIHFIIDDNSGGRTGFSEMQRDTAHIGVLLEDARFSIPGYELSEMFSGLSRNIEEGGLVLSLLLEPIVSNCPICGGIPGATLLNDTIPLSTLGQGWLLGIKCSELDAYFSTVSASNSTCAWSRMRFTHQCCTGLPVSQNECESDLHDQLIKQFKNTVTPPDPGEGQEMLPVNIALDLTHVLDIDMRANTVEIMASLELVWNDRRLKWNPFIGGCTVVSMRANSDPEQTEMWIPEVGLLNQVEGTDGLANSHATVFPDGVVWWKRSGTLKAACDLKGVRMFPFDQSTGNFDFGNARDPLVHRVKVIPWDVEYSDRIRNQSATYQEYQVDWNLTEINHVSEIMSGYTNNIIRFQFYFSRAVSYYMWMFVILYIIFTYMSFGMLFLDEHVGERLGYGTGILFVIVAQDITMSEYTPVTQELLWIYEVSFASKVFVIFGIIESVFVLYLYFLYDFDGDGFDEEAPAPRVSNESILTASANSKNTSRETNSGEASTDAESKRRKCWLMKKLFKYLPDPEDSQLKQKVKRLRLIDRSVAIVFFFVYSFFLLFMFMLAQS